MRTAMRIHRHYDSIGCVTYTGGLAGRVEVDLYTYMVHLHYRMYGAPWRQMCTQVVCEI